MMKQPKKQPPTPPGGILLFFCLFFWGQTSCCLYGAVPCVNLRILYNSTVWVLVTKHMGEIHGFRMTPVRPVYPYCKGTVLVCPPKKKRDAPWFTPYKQDYSRYLARALNSKREPRFYQTNNCITLSRHVKKRNETKRKKKA